MATPISSVHKSSDLVKDYCCGACEEKSVEESADDYCESCQKCFCGECIKLHSQLYARHSTFGRGEMNKWPLSKKMEEFLQRCEVHKDKKLEMFCQDHSQLCCTKCVLLSHRQCTQVALISESVKIHSTDLQRLSVNIESILKELNNLKNNRKASMQSVEGSYNEILLEVKDVRQKINDALDKIEKATLKELDDMRKTLQASLKTNVDNCTRFQDDLKQLSEAVQDLGDKSQEELAFIARKKCLDTIQKSETYIQESSVKQEGSIHFQANAEIGQYMSKLSGLGIIVPSSPASVVQGNPNHVFTVKTKIEYNVRIPSDSSQTSYITGICVISTDKILVTDHNSRRMKLLDQHYSLISHCDMPVSEGDMCKISASEVAVAVAHGVQFISVNNKKLVKGRKVQLQHVAAGIAHHDGNLYVTSRTALYRYNLSGTLDKKLFEDTTGGFTVWKCAVSPTGDKIFVTNYAQHKLLTLARDGTVLFNLADPELQTPFAVHVTPAGHVLVTGLTSHTAIQVDIEGRRKLATLATQKDGVHSPVSVCYNTITDSVIVGQYNNNKLIVLEVQ